MKHTYKSLDMNIRFLFLTIITLLYACSDGKKNNAIPSLDGMNMSTVKITLDEDYYHSVTTHIIDTSFVILKENNQTMFANADKIQTFDGTFYVLDRNSLRTVVSFNRHGEPKAKFGRVGQAPGEYVFPWDMDIDKTGVYILDTNSKKSDSLQRKRNVSERTENSILCRCLQKIG